MKTMDSPIRLEPVIDNDEKPQNRYVTTEILGKGGMGTVFRGVDNTLNREVAIKKLHKKTTGNEATQTEPLSREAKLLATLNHPNIVTVYDVHQEQNDVFIVMELLNGKTLAEISKHEKFEMSELTELVMQTQEALLAANEAGLIHGDLKPQNIIQTKLLNRRSQYKLLDFDQARIIGKERDSLNKHSPSGSIYFMAPERFEGKAATRASDVYAMGCIYYYMLTGQFPCQGDTTMEVMAAHLRGDHTPLAELRPDLPEWVGQWISWLMTLDPNSRPQSPLSVSESFQELLQRYSSVPEKMVSFATPETKPREENWYVARGTQVGGPHTWETVQSFAQSGLLQAQDMVKNDTMPEWERLDAITNSSLQNVG